MIVKAMTATRRITVVIKNTMKRGRYNTCSSLFVVRGFVPGAMPIGKLPHVGMELGAGGMLSMSSAMTITMPESWCNSM